MLVAERGEVTKHLRALPPLRKASAEGYLCRGCGVVIKPPRQTWCSKECREKHYLALSSYARHVVFGRDHGVCALCSCDAEKACRVLSVLRWRTGPLAQDAQAAARLLWSAWTGKPAGLYGWPTGSGLWEADHIIPLAEGGTHDLSNYRTLCVTCHRRETAALAARRAKARRETQSPLPLFNERSEP